MGCLARRFLFRGGFGVDSPADLQSTGISTRSKDASPARKSLVTNNRWFIILTVTPVRVGWT